MTDKTENQPAGAPAADAEDTRQPLRRRLFVLRLAIHTGDSVPTLALRIQNMEQHTEEMGRELAELVSQTIGGAMPVLLGKYSKGQ